jgi:hypothetical protein
VGHVFSESVSILKFPQHPFGDPPQIPPLPCGGICDAFEPVGRGEGAAFIAGTEGTEGTEDTANQGEVETVEERIVDVCAVEILRSVNTPRAEDTASAEVDIWAHEETRVEVVVAMETGGIRLGASPDVV